MVKCCSSDVENNKYKPSISEQQNTCKLSVLHERTGRSHHTLIFLSSTIWITKKIDANCHISSRFLPFLRKETKIFLLFAWFYRSSVFRHQAIYKLCWPNILCLTPKNTPRDSISSQHNFFPNASFWPRTFPMNFLISFFKIVVFKLIKRGWAHRQTDRQTGSQTNRQAVRKTDRESVWKAGWYPERET